MAQGWEPRDRGFQRRPELGLSPTSLEAGRQSSDLTGTADRSLLPTGSVWANGAVWCPVGSQKQPTLQHTWAKELALPFRGPPCLGPWAEERRRVHEMEWGGKHIPTPGLILSVPGPALGFVAAG